MSGFVEQTVANWYSGDIAPAKSGWHPCLSHDGTPTYRLWEENCWWIFSHFEPDEQGEDGGWSLVPNNSISYWADVEGPAITRLGFAGAA